MTPFELEQRRATRQMKVFEAARVIRAKLGGGIAVSERVEHVRVAALSAVAESRATMHALVVKGIATDREVQEFLDWGYDSVLEQVSGYGGAQVKEVGNG